MRRLSLMAALILSLAACSSNSDEKEISKGNNFDHSEESDISYDNYFKENVTEDHWISYDGSSPVHYEFSYTNHIPYIPSKTYTLNTFGYISYFNGDDFVTTKKITKPYPSELETIEDADSIKISFQTERTEDIQLLIKK